MSRQLSPAGVEGLAGSASVGGRVTRGVPTALKTSPVGVGTTSGVGVGVGVRVGVGFGVGTGVGSGVGVGVGVGSVDVVCVDVCSVVVVELVCSVVVDELVSSVVVDELVCSVLVDELVCSVLVDELVVAISWIADADDGATRAAVVSPATTSHERRRASPERRSNCEVALGSPE
jgi:hypothetical protein